MQHSQNHAVISGGSSGIGLAIAKAFTGAGYDVTLLARNESKLRIAAESLGAEWSVADISRRDNVERAVANIERIDVLVNAAGFTRPLSLETDLSKGEADWGAVIDTNLKGTMLLAHICAPKLASPGGRIINISSIAAQMGGSRPGSLAYAAAKSGVHGLTMALARELAPRGITANVVAPGFIAGTGFTGDWPEDRIQGIVNATLAGRAGRPDDVAGAVLWLASEAAGFVTGTVVSVNGGWRVG